MGFGYDGDGCRSWRRISSANFPGGKASVVVMLKLKSELESVLSCGQIEKGKLGLLSLVDKFRIEMEVRSKFQEWRVVIQRATELRFWRPWSHGVGFWVFDVLKLSPMGFLWALMVPGDKRGQLLKSNTDYLIQTIIVLLLWTFRECLLVRSEYINTIVYQYSY